MTVQESGPTLDAVQRVGVLGAGTMGSGIAQVVAEAGVEVQVHDPVEGAYERAHERIARFIRRKVDKGQLDEEAAALVVARIGRAESLEELASADLVIEAIPEDLELKRAAFRRLDAVAEPRTPSWPATRAPCRWRASPPPRHVPTASWACTSSTRSRSWPSSRWWRGP